MNILMVSSFLPYPLTSGGHVRLYNILKELSKVNSITFVCEKRKYQTETDIKEIEKFCDYIFVFDREKQWTMQNILKTGFSPYPFLVTGHMNEEMRQKIQMLLDKNVFDLIHAETSYIMQNIQATPVPIVLVEHNIEYKVYERFMDNAQLFIRPLLYIDILKLKVWEKRIWKKAAALVFVSDHDRNISGEKKAFIVPNGIDPKMFTFRSVESLHPVEKNKEKRILFIGDFKWIQNRDAARWILTEIWPKIKMQLSDIDLWIVGRHIPDGIKNITHDSRVTFDEDAPPETEEIFGRASLLLAPLRVSGGSAYKVLEAMASGVVVVTTTFGAQGIDAQSGKEILVADDAQGLADKTVVVLQDAKQYKGIAQAARALVEEKYNWESIVEDLEKVYKEARKI